METPAQYHAGELPEPPPALELARLAAQLAAGRRRFDPAQLTADAKALYLEAVRTVQQWPNAETELVESLERELVAARGPGFSLPYDFTSAERPLGLWPDDVPPAPKLPAALEQFLRLVVGGKTKGDRLRNYRAFLRWYRAKQGGAEPQEKDELGAVGDLLAKNGKVEWTREQWLRVGEVVRDWKRQAASEHGRKRTAGRRAKRLP